MILILDRIVQLYVPAEGQVWMNTKLPLIAWGKDRDIIYLLSANQRNPCIHSKLQMFLWMAEQRSALLDFVKIPILLPKHSAVYCMLSLHKEKFIQRWQPLHFLVKEIIRLNQFDRKQPFKVQWNMELGLSHFTFTGGSLSSEFLFGYLPKVIREKNKI